MLRGLIFCFSFFVVLLVAEHFHFVWGFNSVQQHLANLVVSLAVSIAATFISMVILACVEMKVRNLVAVYGGTSSATLLLAMARVLPQSDGLIELIVAVLVASIGGAIVMCLPARQREVSMHP